MARNLPSHRWIAAYSAWMATTDWIRVALARAVNPAPSRCVGAARVVFHVDQILVLSWSFLFIALCLHYFTHRPAWLVVPAWLLTFALCLDCTVMRGDALALAYRLVALSTTVIAWASIVWGFVRNTDVKPDLSHLTLILYAATDVVTVTTVWLAPGILESWRFGQLASIVLFAACIVAHARWLLGRRRAEHPRREAGTACQ